jgi:uncharacterized membrane protein YfcA
VDDLGADLLGLLMGSEPLSTIAFVSLVVAALLTSMLSAVVGMAGGITLLGVMLLFLDPLVAIPLHGIVQMVSNGSRTWVQRAHVRRDLTGRYALLLLPSAALGLTFAQALDPVLLKTGIGAFVLVATWRSQWLTFGMHPERTSPHARFVVLGGVAGFLNMTVGAVGPFIAPFFLNIDLTRFQVIGTKAACQLLGHGAKVLIFGLGGFAFGGWAGLLGVLCACVVAGTWLGSRALHHVNDRMFEWLYRSVLTLVALRLIATPLWQAWS